ncbi:MAG: FG-GAP repeat domain-containing protein, partial [Armatimonadota bacterium]
MALGFAILCACAARAEPLTLYELLHTQEPGPDVGFLLRQPVGPLTAGDGAYIAADDWDGDGDADLFAGTPYGDLLYFENLGSEANLEYGMAVALRLSAAAVGEEAGACAPRALDWNGDGVTDLLVCRGGRLFVSLSPGIRTSEPQAVQSVRQPGELANGGRACSVQPIDWNADGLLDLIVGTETGRLLLVAGEGSKASHQFASAKPLTADGEAIRLGANAQVCGWEREGATPQVLVGSSPGGLRLVRAISAEKPLEAEVVPLTLLAGEDGDVLSLDEPSPAVARGAGGEVILLVGTASGFVEAFAQTGPHEFEHRGRLRQQNAPIDVGRFSAPVLADWDGDTVPDLIVGSDEGSIYFFPGKDPRRGTFFPGHRIEAGGRPIVLERDGGALEAGYAQPLVTDWDSDGDPDLLASGDGGYIWLFENRGGSDLPRLLGGRQVRVGRRPIRQRGPVSMAVHDWNLDGDLDLFVGSGARSHGSRGRTHSPFDGGALVPAVSNGGVVYYENIAASPTLPPRFFKGARLDCKVPVVFPAETIRDAAMLDLGIVGITDWDG